MKQKPPRNAARGAFSFLELQVALVLFGIALAGLVPLVVMQSKHLKRIEGRLDHRTTYYLAPSSDDWASKLGAPATIETTDPGEGSSSPATNPVYELNVLSFDRSATSETVQARVGLIEIPD